MGKTEGKSNETEAFTHTKSNKEIIDDAIMLHKRHAKDETGKTDDLRPDSVIYGTLNGTLSAFKKGNKSFSQTKKEICANWVPRTRIAALTREKAELEKGIAKLAKCLGVSTVFSDGGERIERAIERVIEDVVSKVEALKKERDELRMTADNSDRFRSDMVIENDTLKERLRQQATEIEKLKSLDCGLTELGYKKALAAVKGKVEKISINPNDPVVCDVCKKCGHYHIPEDAMSYCDFKGDCDFIKGIKVTLEILREMGT